MPNLFVFCWLIISVFSFGSMHARFLKSDELSVRFDEFSKHVVVKPDGRSKTRVHFVAVIQKEGGRDYFSTYRLNYNGDSETLHLIDAHTVSSSGERKQVSKQSIEDKAVASSLVGFDETRQLKLSFGSLDIGSKVVLTYELKVEKPMLPGHFETSIGFLPDVYVKSFDYQLESALPLVMKVYDQKRFFKIEHDGSQSELKKLSVKIDKPMVLGITDEPGRLPWQKIPRIELSSFKSWDELSAGFTPGYQAVASQPLPAMFAAIVKQAKAKKTIKEQINTVTASLAEKVQYQGDWRSVSGRYFPRSLKRIVATGQGDCKDFTISTVVMLRALGLDAYPALVHRGYNDLQWPADIAKINTFNHAFVYVKRPSGSDWWVDPTNQQSMAGLTFDDVSDKPALVLKEGIKRALKKTSPFDPNVNKIQGKKTITMSNEHAPYVMNQVIYQTIGKASLRFTAAGLYVTPEIIAEYFLRKLATRPANTKGFEYKLPALKSRVVQDLLFKFTWLERDLLNRTNAGHSIHLGSHLPEALLEIKKGDVGEVLLKPPFETAWTNVYQLSGGWSEVLSLDFHCDEPWIKMDRTVRFDKATNQVTVDNHIISRLPVIPPQLHQSERFQQWRASVDAIVSGASLVWPE